jgi:hypothetical protein
MQTNETSTTVGQVSGKWQTRVDGSDPPLSRGILKENAEMWRLFGMLLPQMTIKKSTG